jgi:hypothetical protein
MKQNPMKKFVLPAIGLLASLLTAQAQSFSPTNLVVMRLGGPSQTLATSGNTMNLDQYTTAGTFVNSVTIPDSGTNALICGGTSATEGYISLSANGKYIVWSGYNTNRGSVSVALSATGATTNSRGVATLDGNGNYILQFAGNVESVGSIRGAVSDGSNNFWIEGANTGIIYVGNNSPLVTVSTSTANERCLHIFNNNLYYSTGSAAGSSPGLGFWEVPGLPTVAGGNNVNAAGGQLGGTSPEDFVVNTNLGIAYLCDDDASSSGGGIIRYTYTGGIWVSNYTISTGTGGAYAVVVDWSQTHPVLYVTVGTSTVAAGNALATITDTGASASPTVLATAPTGTFRGLSWAPGAGPVITAQSGSVIFDVGQTATFSVTATGSPILSYQWYSNSVANTNFVAVASGTNATLSLPNLSSGQSGSMFYAIVSNAYGTAQSTNVTLTVDPAGPPMYITVIPSSQTVNAGSTAVFNVTFAGGINGLSFGWTRNGTPVANGSLGGSTNYGATTPTLTISNALAVDAGSYEAFVTNSFSSGSGGPGVLTVNDPAIITSPVGETNLPGGSGVTLCVTADGSGLTYQWLSNSIPIPGAHSPCYSVASSVTPFAASYSVIVSNSLGASVTTSATVVSYTPLLLSDSFSYPNGDLFGDPGSPWTDINGTNPEAVINGRVQISQLENTTDAQSFFTQPVGPTVVWASFIINLTQLPSNPGGVYFANMEDTNFGFFGRIFCLTSNNASVTTPAGISTVAFPGTYRLGIAGGQNDFASNSTTGPTAVVPLDLAPNTDYQVVYYLDLSSDVAAMAVNPAALSDVTAGSPVIGVSSGATSDTINPTNKMAAFGLRQRVGEGILQMDNLEVSFDWNGSYSGYPVVTAGITTNPPVIGLQPVGITNYSGNPYTMEVAASGIGAPGVGLTYAWYRGSSPLSDGADVTGSLTPTLLFNSLSSTDNGTYHVTVTGTGGTTNSSSNAIVSVILTPTPPSFTLPGALEPQSATAPEGSSVTFTAKAVGTGPITYEWYFNSPSSPQGAGSSLTLNGVTPGQAGNYYVVATGDGSTQSSNAVLTVTAPVATNIAYLRSLQDVSGAPTSITVSDTTTLFTITGVVTTATNLTSGDTSSYYLQDSTDGINLFITGDSSFRPALGDLVTATGLLSEYYDNLEIDVVSGAQFQTYTDLGPTNWFPTPQILPWGYAAANPGLTALNIYGSLVTMTNVYFETNATTNVFTNTITRYYITNASGVPFIVFVSAQDTNFDGQPIPGFASSVTGVVYEDEPDVLLIVTRYSDIVTNASLPPVTITNLAGSIAGTNFTLTWTAVPNTASYSVLYATSVAGPWTNKLATGLTFANTQGMYTTSRPTNSANFYDVSSP